MIRAHRVGNQPRRFDGFTLIEVLVALVIVAVGMAALMGALSSSASSVSYTKDKTFAEWVALNQIANLRLQLQPGQVPPKGNTNGDIDYAGRSWHWRQEVVATQVQGMERIDVKVRPADVKAGDDNGWFVTVSGIVGDAVAAPGVTILNWGSSTLNLNGSPNNSNNPTLNPNSGTLNPNGGRGPNNGGLGNGGGLGSGLGSGLGNGNPGSNTPVPPPNQSNPNQGSTPQ